MMIWPAQCALTSLTDMLSTQAMTEFAASIQKTNPNDPKPTQAADVTIMTAQHIHHHNSTLFDPVGPCLQCRTG